MAKKEIYICNGKRFSSYDEVIQYCKENSFRVSNTTTLKRNTYLIDIVSI